MDNIYENLSFSQEYKFIPIDIEKQLETDEDTDLMLFNYVKGLVDRNNGDELSGNYSNVTYDEEESFINFDKNYSKNIGMPRDVSAIEEYDYLKIDKIVDKIENNNPGIFKFLESKGVPYSKIRSFIRRIIRLTIMYE